MVLHPSRVDVETVMTVQYYRLNLYNYQAGSTNHCSELATGGAGTQSRYCILPVLQQQAASIECQMDHQLMSSPPACKTVYASFGKAMSSKCCSFKPKKAKEGVKGVKPQVCVDMLHNMGPRSHDALVLRMIPVSAPSVAMCFKYSSVCKVSLHVGGIQ